MNEWLNCFYSCCQSVVDLFKHMDFSLAVLFKRLCGRPVDETLCVLFSSTEDRSVRKEMLLKGFNSHIPVHGSGERQPSATTNSPHCSFPF